MHLLQVSFIEYVAQQFHMDNSSTTSVDGIIFVPAGTDWRTTVPAPRMRTRYPLFSRRYTASAAFIPARSGMIPFDNCSEGSDALACSDPFTADTPIIC